MVGEQISIYSKDLLYKNVKSIHNEYGPSECSVCSTYKKIERDDTVITIGQPIANTQVYILDGKQKLLPIGVAGELCIAGDGVGKGYLNQPGLTGEKFISNPFTTKENGHGKVLYRTGDLACWRADGELEYLGRIDTQVKIRGLRIELGEIESVMSEVDGIALTAAAAQRDEKGRQYLVGYYTVDDGVISDVSKDTDNLTADISAKVGFATKAISDIESKLHAHLTTKLPRYMIPNFFVHLDAMPMTASGKTDRKNLPLPDFSEIGKAYVAPSTKQEKELCGILREVLSADKIGVSDDFFDMGGDSLAAISYVAMAHEKGYDFSLQDVYDYPTVENLIVAMNGSRNTAESYNAESFKKYETLLSVNVTEDRAIFKKQSLGNVLLTGATGFLGAHILDSFLSDEKGKLYCLVRGGSEAEKRLYATLRYYFGHKYDGQIGKRIVVVNGDITQDSLADFLPKDVQTVIHAAATVKHFGPDDYFERINKDGTAHITEYAKRINARLIHISTVSVSGNMLADNMEIDRSGLKLDYNENMLYAGQPLDNVYVKSKFEAERVVLDNMLEGLNAKIIRVGNLTNRASDYKFQSNYSENAFLKRIKAVLEFGEFPDYLMEQYAEFSPVDYTASGIIRIAQFSGDYSVFHLNSNKPLYYQDMLVMLENLGISMRVVEGDTFYKDIEKTIGKREQAYIFEALQNDMDKDGRLLYESSIHIKNDFTVWFLKHTGFEWNEIDEEYVIGYIDYFRKLGYLDV